MLRRMARKGDMSVKRQSIAKTNRGSCKIPGEELGRRQAAALARAAQASGQHEVGLPPLEGSEHSRGDTGPVAAVAIDKEHQDASWRVGTLP